MCMVNCQYNYIEESIIIMPIILSDYRYSSMVLNKNYAGIIILRIIILNYSNYASIIRQPAAICGGLIWTRCLENEVNTCDVCQSHRDGVIYLQPHLYTHGMQWRRVQNSRGPTTTQYRPPLLTMQVNFWERSLSMLTPNGCESTSSSA